MREAGSSKKILIIGYVWPEPNSSAAGIRMLELIRLFQTQLWQVVFASPAALSGHRFDLASLGIPEQSIRLNDPGFDEFIAELQPDAVLFDRFFTEEQFGWRVEAVCPNALRILDTEDIHSLRHVRHLILKQAQHQAFDGKARNYANPVLASAEELYSAMAGNDMAQREIASIYRCDLSLIISTYEMDLLTGYFLIPKPLLQYCPFLAENVSERQQLPSYEDRQHFIAIGNFRHEPNWDALKYLKHAIWPLIRAQLPQTELRVYGAYPPPKATQLHNTAQGFVVKGWVENAPEVMRNARACLAPLRFGAGIKGKLLDAMRAGTPSITTSIGAEGILGGDLVWGGAIANHAKALAAAAVQLYCSEPLWRQAQQQGYDILKRYFHQQNHAALLMNRINELMDNLAQERRQNFTGVMLRHELHKSKYFMAKWLEEKSMRFDVK